jgi:hypothetical protein
MADRYRTADGWSVEVVNLTGTPDRHDGQWLRICYCNYWVDVRSIAELEQWFPLADLEPDALALAA